MNRRIFFLLAIIGALFLGSCDNKSEYQDNQTSGYIKVSVDETYKPVLEQAIKVFESRYPDAHINVEYKPEADCFEDYLNDTTRVILVSRKLTDYETSQAEENKIVSRVLPLARDALAFVVAKNAKRNNFSKKQIKDILVGNSNAGDFQLVFDNKNSSTVRNIIDSVIPGQELSENIYAAKGSEDVIDYVAGNPTAIGVVGVPWVADTRDTNTIDFLSKVQVAGILPDSGKEFLRPYQAYIGLNTYPFTRNLYFISKDTRVGLGTGFVNFLSRDGQLIFKQSKLFPLQVNVLLKQTEIKNN
jgi:phosphate transport system substrate-binding protein